MSKVDVSRRTAVAMLGLAPASAVGAESFIPPPDNPRHSTTGISTNERIAAALRKLADAMESGAADAEAIALSSVISPDEIVKHTMAITFVYYPEAETS